MKKIEIPVDKMDELLQRLETRSFLDTDYELLKNLILTVVNLNHEVEKKGISIQRLRRLFGIKTEKLERLLKTQTETKAVPASKDNKSPKKKGHGRLGADDYVTATSVIVPHQSLKAGDKCSLCFLGKIYPNVEPGVFVRVTAQTPFAVTVYEQEKFRCNGCGAIFSAQVPEDVAGKKHDESVSAMLACLKYGSGMPFYRITRLLAMCDVPFPPATQWELLRDASLQLSYIFQELVRFAAQAELLYVDDTNMKILSVIKENKTKDKTDCRAVFTTGIVAKVGDREIALYYTGPHHAGENMTVLLAQREKDLKPPIQMCDGLSRNIPQQFEVILANCLTHGRRQFVDIMENFPEECRHVLVELSKVYEFDAQAQNESMTPEERLLFHKNKSESIMENLKIRMNQKLDSRQVEPNGGLGKAFEYMLKRWEPLTRFLRVPGAPLDNNTVERSLKKAVLHRKNSMFYKTLNGAHVGDIFMSLIETCCRAKVNPFKYITAVLKNAPRARDNPSVWLPWNYLTALDEKKT